MAEPTEDEVRAHLEREAATMERSAETARMVRFDDSTHMRLAAIYRSALALLDEARKDRERLDWIDGKSLDGIHVEVWAKGNPDIRVEREACVYWRGVEAKCANLRAAIDQARGA